MIGMDITPEMLEQGRMKLAHLGLEDRIDLRIGDAEQIDLREGRRRMVGHSVMSTKVQERTTFQRRSYQRSPDFWSGPKNADTAISEARVENGSDEP